MGSTSPTATSISSLHDGRSSVYILDGKLEETEDNLRLLNNAARRYIVSKGWKVTLTTRRNYIRVVGASMPQVRAMMVYYSDRIQNWAHADFRLYWMDEGRP